MTEPLSHFSKIYPFDNHRINRLVIGEKYAGILLKNGQIGVCSTLRNDVDFDIISTPKIDLENINHRIIYNTYLNALLNYHNNYKADIDIFEALDFSQNDNIVMVGYFRPLVKKFNTANIPLKIFDLYEKDDIVQPASQQITALKDANTVILTSTSIFNNTFSDIIQYTHQNCHIYLLGPSSILHQHMLKYRNITNIFGAVFEKNDQRILETIKKGNGTRTFLPLGTKVYI